MTRVLTVEAKPLDENHILGLRERFASAKFHGVEFEWDHGFGFGSTSLSITAVFPGGRRVSETISLADMLSEWAIGVIDSNFIVRADADDNPAHLEPVTHQVNITRAAERRRATQED